MENEYYDFLLPVGYIDFDGKIHRECKMRLTTAVDEISLYDNEDIKFNELKHDVLMLSKVVMKIGDIDTVDATLIESLFDIDFRYMQIVYQFINGVLDKKMSCQCPKCNSKIELNALSLYKNIDYYLDKNINNGG